MYDGQWEDKEHGYGKFIFPNGAVYEGEFVKGKKEGKAKYSDPSGAIYEGSFVAGDAKPVAPKVEPKIEQMAAVKKEEKDDLETPGGHGVARPKMELEAF